MLTTGQVTASGGTISALCHVPPGPCLVILSSDPASAATAYIGTPATTSGHSRLPTGSRSRSARP